jgi:YbbR domain-containing protein
MSTARTMTSHLVTLLFSLLAALVIWVVAIQQQDVQKSNLLTLPVQVEGLAADSQIANAPEEVQIRVEGPTSIIDALTTDQFTAIMDVTDLPSGMHEVQILVSPQEIDRVNRGIPSPSSAQVTIERIITKDIPVNVDVRGEVARGYELGDPFVDPGEIQITGIASRVEPIAEARIDIFLDGPREDVTRERTPIFYNRLGETVSVSGLELSTRVVQVTIPVDQQAGFSVIPVIVDWVGQPATGYRVLSVSVEPDSVLVTGRPTQLDQISFLRTETIDINGLQDSFFTQAAINLPDGLMLEDEQSVLVSFEIEPIISTNVVRKTPEIRNLEIGFTTTLDIDQVVVFLAGPFDKLEALTDDDILVTLDLLGLMTGTHRITANPSVLVTDIEVRSVQPQTVTVTIEPIITPTTAITETLSFVPLPAGVVSGASGHAGAGLMVMMAVLPAGQQIFSIWRGRNRS